MLVEYFTLQFSRPCGDFRASGFKIIENTVYLGTNKLPLVIKKKVLPNGVGIALGLGVS